MTTSYMYTLSQFPMGTVSLSQLGGEILVSITPPPTYKGTTLSGSNVTIFFDASLSVPQQTTLNNIVSTHIPSAFQSDTIIQADGYLQLESKLADNNALRILASNAAGGISITSGLGGILQTSTNTITLNAGAQSQFTTSVGNLIFTSGGLVNIESNSGGINIGTNTVSQTLNFGSGLANKTIMIGNMTSSTTLNLRGGTGGILADTTGPISLDAFGSASNFTLTGTANNQNLAIALLGGYDARLQISSTGTTVNALEFSAVNAGGGSHFNCGTGGFRIDTSGQIYLATSQAGGGNITLDASSGGLNFQCGVFGMSMNASGSGVIFIGSNSDTGTIEIGNSASSRRVLVGSTNTTSCLILRYGTNGLITYQPVPIDMGSGSFSPTTSQLLIRILSGTATLGANITLPSASTIISSMKTSIIGDSISFTIINKSGAQSYTMVVGTGGTIEGNSTISPNSSEHFLLRLSNISGGTEAYVLYRIS